MISLLLAMASTWAASPIWDGSPESEDESRYRPAVSTGGMVSADDRVAAEWGVEILRRGGNAIDAAVATGFAMAVTRPQYASLGGGGFLLYCGAKAPSCAVIDYREEAPSKASRDMFIRDGKPRTDLSQDGALASGVPGVPAGLLKALEKFGSRKRAELLQRPIELAEKGYAFTGRTETVATLRWDAFNAEAKRVFGCGTSKACEPGKKLKQPELARVLREISSKGADGFYKGWVAEKIAQGLQAEGGIMTAQDLAAYRAKDREPVRARVRFPGRKSDYQIVSMPPPSAGGAVILQMLRYAELADQQGAFDEGPGSAKTIHALTHAMSLGFADRAKYFGDPDHVQVPLAEMLSDAYLKKRWETYKPGKAAIPAGAGPIQSFKEGNQTTHFSVIDREGNAVAVTTTVNDIFGSGFVPPGTGIVMNNEMDDFSVQPGVPNLFGLVGAEANAVGPRKRPLSSMSPTIVRDSQGRNLISIGSQGGPKITTSVFLSLFNRLRFGMSLPDAVQAPRFHHQWKPAALMIERGAGFSSDTRSKLSAMGYTLEEIAVSAKLNAVERFPNGRAWGVADLRTEGAAIGE